MKVCTFEEGVPAQRQCKYPNLRSLMQHLSGKVNYDGRAYTALRS